MNIPQIIITKLSNKKTKQRFDYNFFLSMYVYKNTHSKKLCQILPNFNFLMQASNLDNIFLSFRLKSLKTANNSVKQFRKYEGLKILIPNVKFNCSFRKRDYNAVSSFGVLKILLVRKSCNFGFAFLKVLERNFFLFFLFF